MMPTGKVASKPVKLFLIVSSWARSSPTYGNLIAHTYYYSRTAFISLNVMENYCLTSLNDLSEISHKIFNGLWNKKIIT